MSSDWWGTGIMDGDIPRDIEAFLCDMIGGHLEAEAGSVYTRVMVERGMLPMLGHIRNNEAPEVGMQVLGHMILRSGAYLTRDVCSEIVKAVKADDPFWRGQNDPLRQAAVQELVNKLEAHQATATMPCMLAVKEPVVQVGVAVMLLKPGAILMGRRRGSHGEDTWSFPGGHMEFGETVIGTAQRELKEETGIDLFLDRFRKVTYTNDFFVAEHKHYITLYVAVDWTPLDGEPKLLEPEKCFEWGWQHKPPKNLFLCIQNLIRQGGWPLRLLP